MNLLNQTTADVFRNWKSLLATDIFYKVVAYIFLTPLLALLLRLFLWLSGNTVLADQDILFFVLGPVGLVGVIAIASVWLCIVALELAALMLILATGESRKSTVRPIQAVQFALLNALPVVKVTLRMVAWSLVIAAPFLITVAAIYFGLLSDYDINYYLKERPPVFVGSVAIAAVLAIVLAILLLRLFSRWFFALPLVLFENAKPSTALRLSGERTLGHRPRLLLWILVWYLITTMVSAVITSILLKFGQVVVPKAAGSLSTLVFAIGVSLLVWTLANVIINLFSTTFFAAMLIRLYQRFGCTEPIKLERHGIAPDRSKPRLRFSAIPVWAFCVIGIIAASGIGIYTFSTVRLDDDVSIVAHRGASHAAPENTMAAIRLAIEEGADWVEIDVQETADGEVAVFHDSDFMKLAGVNLKIWDATREDLKRIDIGSWLSPEFKDERVPLLTDLLAYCKGKVKVDIELKYYGHDKQLEQRVVDIVEAHDMATQVMVMSLKIESVRKMKSLRPGWKVGLLMSVTAGDLRKIDADFLAVNAGFADWAFIKRAHAIDKEVLVWTVNDPISMSNMIGRGVDGLITDKPGLARTVLKMRSELNAAERLLLELAGILGVPAEIYEQ